MKHIRRPFFLEAFPLSLKEAIIAPLVWRENALGGMPGLLMPGMGIMRDFSGYAGYSYGALRTALSRSRSSGEVEAFRDEAGALRFRMGRLSRAIGAATAERSGRPEGYLLAVFSFTTAEEPQRRRLRELLGWFGFVRIAQNSYACGLMDRSGLEAALEEEGLSERVYLFSCPAPQDPGLEKRLARAFDLGARAAELEAFRRAAGSFLEEEGLDARERGRRLFYAGPVYHELCNTRESPLPATCLPEGYPLEGIHAWFRGLVAERMGDIAEYYRSCEG